MNPLPLDAAIEAAEAGDRFARLYLLALGGFATSVANGDPKGADIPGTHLGVVVSSVSLDMVGPEGWPKLFASFKQPASASSESPSTNEENTHGT